MIDKYVIKRNAGYIQVFEVNHQGHRGIAAEVYQDATLADIAQEFYEVIASIGGIKVEMEDDI